jgi:hypothetical protein
MQGKMTACGGIHDNRVGQCLFSAAGLFESEQQSSIIA